MTIIGSNKKSPSKLSVLADTHPYTFVILLFIVENALAVPFVVLFRIMNTDLEPLRLLIPVVQSGFMIWVVWQLGWFNTSGFRRDVKELHLYWYPVLLALIPVLLYDSINIPTGPLAFYTAALLFTAISEETLARGVIIPALLKKGTWTAILAAAGLFSISHLTNLVFSDPGFLKMMEVLLVTFGFAVLYGAIFIRTGNIFPLIVLHMLHDYFLVTSGTAGPFLVQPLSPIISCGLAIVNIVYGAILITRTS